MSSQEESNAHCLNQYSCIPRDSIIQNTLGRCGSEDKLILLMDFTGCQRHLCGEGHRVQGEERKKEAVMLF